MVASLHLEVVGKNGPPLVLLHGWGWNSDVFLPLIPRLTENFQLFLVDLPGFGKSGLLTNDYTFETVSALLFEKLPEKAAWLGWSFGGLIAWWIAIHRPEKVTRLITIGSTPKFTGDADWPGISEAALTQFSKALASDYQKTLQDFLELQLRGSRDPALVTELQKKIAATPDTVLPSLEKSLKLLCEADLRADLNQMTVPSLHFFGSIDTLVPVKAASLIQDKIRYGRCEIIKRAGHLLFLSHQEEFLYQFLRK